MAEITDGMGYGRANPITELVDVVADLSEWTVFREP